MAGADEPMLEGYTTLGYLAGLTRRMTLGLLATGVMYRNPVPPAVNERTRANAMHLWVLRQNTTAQRYYYRSGATLVESAPVPPPGGDPARQNGSPSGLPGTDGRHTAALGGDGAGTCL